MGENEKNYIIRNYKDEDSSQIAEFDLISMLAYRYNGDYINENIFCAVGMNGEVLASAYIAPDQSWGLIEKEGNSEEFVFKLIIDITVNETKKVPPSVTDDLMKAVMVRAKQISAKYPHKRITLSHTITSDNLEEIDFYLSNGFITKQNHLVMKKDLTEPIPKVLLSNHINIINWKMETEEELVGYLKAEADSDHMGVSWSLNHLKWTKSGAEWDTFTAFSGNQIVGSVMTWGLGEARSATENVFVLPQWRRMGVARAVMTEALIYLKEKGKTEATLGVLGNNCKAIALYQSLGYHMFYTNIEFGYDL